jgi:hypothetical protein
MMGLYIGVTFAPSSQTFPVGTSSLTYDVTMTIPTSITTSSSGQIITWLLSGDEAPGYDTPLTTTYDVTVGHIVLEALPSLIIDGTSWNNLLLTIDETPLTQLVIYTNVSGHENVTLITEPYPLVFLNGDTQLYFNLSAKSTVEGGSGRRLLASQDGVGGTLPGLSGFVSFSISFGGIDANHYIVPSPENVTLYSLGKLSTHF